MFFGHPVERLCTYQYSLISLIPSTLSAKPGATAHLFTGLLQTLDDCGSPPLAARAPTLSRPNSLRTSDRKSMLAYLGLPLDLFGKVIQSSPHNHTVFIPHFFQDAFFQPYLPLQQLDLLKDSQSWLCGSTNTIVAQQKEIDLLIDVRVGYHQCTFPEISFAD